MLECSPALATTQASPNASLRRHYQQFSIDDGIRKEGDIIAPLSLLSSQPEYSAAILSYSEYAWCAFERELWWDDCWISRAHTYMKIYIYDILPLISPPTRQVTTWVNIIWCYEFIDYISKIYCSVYFDYCCCDIALFSRQVFSPFRRGFSEWVWVL